MKLIFLKRYPKIQFLLILDKYFKWILNKVEQNTGEFSLL